MSAMAFAGPATAQTCGVEGAAISSEKQALIKERALAACYALDGLSDGVIADTAACAASFSPRDLAYSSFADSNSIDLTEFAGNGGKMILVQGTTDMLVPPSTTTDWFVKTSAALGPDADDTIRYYIQPGYGHGFGAFNLGWDSLTELDSWVETGTAPQDQNKASSFVCSVK